MFREAAIRLRVGEANPQLDALLAKVGLETAACVRAGRERVRRDLAEALEERGNVGDRGGDCAGGRDAAGGGEIAGAEDQAEGGDFSPAGRRAELVFAG